MSSSSTPLRPIPGSFLDVPELPFSSEESKKTKRPSSSKRLKQLDREISSLQKIFVSHVVDVERVQKKLKRIEHLSSLKARKSVVEEAKEKTKSFREEYKNELDIIQRLGSKGINSGKVNLDNTNELGVNVTPSKLGAICALRVLRKAESLEFNAAKQEALKELKTTLEFHPDYDTAQQREFNKEFLKQLGIGNVTLLADLASGFELRIEDKIDIIKTICEKLVDLNLVFESRVFQALQLPNPVIWSTCVEILRTPKLLSKVSAKVFVNSLANAVGVNEAYKLCLGNAHEKFIRHLNVESVQRLINEDHAFYQSFIGDLLRNNIHFILRHLDYLIPDDAVLKEELLINLSRGLPILLIDRIDKFNLQGTSIYFETILTCAELAPYEIAIRKHKFNLNPEELSKLADTIAGAMLIKCPDNIRIYLHTIEVQPPGHFMHLVADALLQRAPEVFIKNIQIFEFGNAYNIKIANKVVVLAPEILGEHLTSFKISDQKVIADLSEKIQKAKPSKPRVPRMRAAASPVSSSSSSAPVQAPQSTIKEALRAAYGNVFSSIAADCYEKYFTPKIVDLVNDFRKNPKTMIRYSKKEPPHLPFGMTLRKKKNSDIVLYIHAHKNEDLGNGTFSRVKRSSKVQINSANQAIFARAAIGRTKHNVTYDNPQKGILHHQQILKAIKKKYPGRFIHIVPKMNFQVYQPYDFKKKLRLESFNNEYWGSMLKLEALKKEKHVPLKGNRAILNAFSQIAEALSMMSELGYVHGDVKAGNILLDAEGRAFLHDFDYTQEMGPGKTKTVYYPWDYAAENSIMTPNCDIYGLVINAARMLIPGLEQHVPCVNDDKPALLRWVRTPLIDAFANCVLSSNDKECKAKMNEIRELRLSNEEIEKALEKNFPIPFGMLKILKRELENGVKLYDYLTATKAPRHLREWREIVQTLKLTTAEQLQTEFLELCERDRELNG